LRKNRKTKTGAHVWKSAEKLNTKLTSNWKYSISKSQVFSFLYFNYFYFSVATTSQNSHHTEVRLISTSRPLTSFPWSFNNSSPRSTLSATAVVLLDSSLDSLWFLLLKLPTTALWGFCLD
jgi:hypothetical protein